MGRPLHGLAGGGLERTGREPSVGGGVLSCGSIGYVSGIADRLKPEGGNVLRAPRA